MFRNVFSRNANLRPIRSRPSLQIEALEERSLLCCPACFGLPLVAPVSAAPPVAQVGLADTMIDLDHSDAVSTTPAAGSEFRAPDLYRASVGLSTPIPFVSGSAEIAFDPRHGQIFFTPGAGVGYSTPISASFTGEWLDQPTTPTREQISGYATGPGGNALLSAWPTMPGLVAGKSAVPGSGTATVVGVSTPEYGVNGGYGIKLLDPAEARSFTIDPADSRAGLPGYNSNGWSDLAYPEDALARSVLGLPVPDTDVLSTIFGQDGGE